MYDLGLSRVDFTTASLWKPLSVSMRTTSLGFKGCWCRADLLWYCFCCWWTFFNWVETLDVLSGLSFCSFIDVGSVVRVRLESRRWAGESMLYLGVFRRFGRPNWTPDPSFLHFSNSCFACLTAFSAKAFDCAASTAFSAKPFDCA